MNRSKVISILRGDPIEQFLEDLDRKIKNNWLSRGILELVFTLVIIAIVLWVLSGFLGI